MRATENSQKQAELWRKWGAIWRAQEGQTVLTVEEVIAERRQLPAERAEHRHRRDLATAKGSRQTTSTNNQRRQPKLLAERIPYLAPAMLKM